LIGVIGIFFGRRLLKIEEWRATGIVILALSIIGALYFGLIIILWLFVVLTGQMQ
jgi:hypothetical protein